MTKPQTNLLLLFIATLFVVVFFVFISPADLTLMFVFVPFILIFVILFWSIRTFLDLFFSLTTFRKRTISLVLSIMPVVMLVIQSVTQLTTRDVVLCLFITLIIVWYVSRIDRPSA